MTDWMFERVKERQRNESSAARSEVQNLSEQIKTAEAKTEKLVFAFARARFPFQNGKDVFFDVLLSKCSGSAVLDMTCI